jgi:hypothetical protein
LTTRPNINPKPAGHDQGRRADPIPTTVPCYSAEWEVLGLDCEPVPMTQLSYGRGAGDRLAAALAAARRAGQILGVGLVVDRRTGEQIYPVAA